MAIITCGRALLWRRDAVDGSDLAFARRFVRSSTPGQRGRVLLALFEGVDEVEQIQERTRLSYDTVNRTLEDLEAVGVVQRLGTRKREGRGKPATIWGRADEQPDPDREALRAEDD